jgi:hypothetical protein
MRRKFLLLILILSTSALFVNCQTVTNAEKPKPCKYLSFEEAEKILGAKVELVTNSWEFTKDITRFRCHYRAVEPGSGQEINLFFMLEEDSTETAARSSYAEIWNSNKSSRGIEVLNGVGDEAYTHTDPPNFQFATARKGKFTVRVKINKAPEIVSFESLKAFLKRTVEQI